MTLNGFIITEKLEYCNNGKVNSANKEQQIIKNPGPANRSGDKANFI